MNLLTLIKKHSLTVPAVIVILLITCNTAIIYYNQYILKKTNAEKVRTERVMFLLGKVWDDVVRNVDIAVRGYALGRTEALLSPRTDAIKKAPVFLQELREITASQGMLDDQPIDSISIGVDNFVAVTELMIQAIDADQMAEFKRLMDLDPGKDTWFIYDRNSKIITDFENQLQQQAVTSYENANFRTAVFQTILFFLALPTLIFLIVKIRQDARSRADLFKKLDKNNRDFLFNPGEQKDSFEESEVIENSIRNLKKATNFIGQVAGGNFAAEWDNQNTFDAELNKENLAGELVRMRDRMLAIKQQDDMRNWTAEGIAQISEIIRNRQEDVSTLCYHTLVFITKYMKAQQGAVFVLKEEGDDQYLEMVACYAFDRRKHVQKRLEIGQGLIGQTYLEGSSVMLTDVPNGYTSITSGLGESTPGCVLIVPFKSNEVIEAVVEIAAYRTYQKYEIEFLEKVGEVLSSALSNVRNTEKMKTLLEQFKVQTEQLKSQEEELRQNMEEMEATQESVRRNANGLG
jgi:CHASE3 domain sensor protein